MKFKQTITMLMLGIVLATCVILGNGKNIQSISEKKYFDTFYGTSTISDSFEETVNYSSYQRITNKIPAELPTYAAQYTCGPTSGAVIVGYYDKTFTNLIPNFEPGTLYGGTLWVWKSSIFTEVQTMYTQVMSNMGGSQNGTTIPEYTGGLFGYITDQGYDMAIHSSNNGTNGINANFISAVQNEQPVTLFLSTYNTANVMQLSNGVHRLTVVQYDTPHIMTAYGYEDVIYYDSSNNIIRQDRYLLVNSGLGSLTRLYLNNYCTLDYAMAVEVY